MKKLFRIFVVISMLGCVLVLGACKQEADNDDKENTVEADKILDEQEAEDDENKGYESLYAQGLELISLMDEMAESEEYIELYTTNEDVKDIAAEFGKGDYTEPKEVYQIKIPQDTMDDADYDELSGDLKKYVTSSNLKRLPTMLNTSYGEKIILATSICSAEKTFISDELKKDTIYLYSFEDAAPIMVTFLEGEDGSVLASGQFVYLGELENVEELIEEKSFDVKVITE